MVISAFSLYLYRKGCDMKARILRVRCGCWMWLSKISYTSSSLDNNYNNRSNLLPTFRSHRCVRHSPTTSGLNLSGAHSPWITPRPPPGWASPWSRVNHRSPPLLPHIHIRTITLPSVASVPPVAAVAATRPHCRPWVTTSNTDIVWISFCRLRWWRRWDEPIYHWADQDPSHSLLRYEHLNISILKYYIW